MSTTEYPSPPRSPGALPRNPSLTSLISFSVTSSTSEKKSHHTLITAPCSRCGHAEPIKSLLSVVEKSILHCPSCTDDNNTNVSTFDGIVSKTTLYKSFADLESTLQRHGSDLDRLSILPRPTAVLKELDDGNKPRDDSTSVRSFTVLANEPESQHIECAQSTVPHKSNRSSYTGGYPLVHDVEDLKQLTAGVTRLLKTLHDKVTRLDLEERMLRNEREELSKKCEDIDRLRKMLAQEGGFGGDGTRSPESLREVGSPKDRMSKSFEIGDDYQDGRSLALSRTMSFVTVDYNRPEVVWNKEKEQQLRNLEKRLVRANRNWSDEQEDVLPLVESLREERRKAKKLTAGEESPRKIRGGSFSFIGRRDSRARRDSGDEEKKEKVRRGSAGDENRAKSGLMRFFSKREGA